MPTFRLTEQAEIDLDRLTAQSIDTWGPAQTAIYISAIDFAFSDLAENPSLGRRRFDLGKDVLAHYCGRHVIFFYRLETGDIQVLRILHDRMDFERHL